MTSEYRLTVGPQALITAAQDLTASWADLGGELTVGGMRSIALFVTLDINSGADARVRLVGMHATGGTAHVLPIKTVSAAAVSVEAEYLEFNVDADVAMVIDWDINGVLPFAKFQVQAGTPGTPAAQIDAASVTFSY